MSEHKPIPFTHLRLLLFISILVKAAAAAFISILFVMGRYVFGKEYLRGCLLSVICMVASEIVGSKICDSNVSSFFCFLDRHEKILRIVVPYHLHVLLYTPKTVFVQFGKESQGVMREVL